jgi:hypothetical protein
MIHDDMELKHRGRKPNFGGRDRDTASVLKICNIFILLGIWYQIGFISSKASSLQNKIELV